MAVARKYVAFLQRRGLTVFCLTLAISLCAAPLAVKLSSVTVESFPASPGTRSAGEGLTFQGEFPSVFNDRETIYVRCLARKKLCACSLQTCDGFQRVFHDLNTGLAEQLQDGTVKSITSFFDVAHDPKLAGALGSQYYNESASSMIFTLSLDTAMGEPATRTATTVVQGILNTINDAGHFDTYLSGRLATQATTKKEIGKIFGMTEGTGMLFIVILFGFRTRSWRLTLIPFVNTVCCLFLAEAICYPLASSGLVTVPSFVPNVCMFLCIALSVDYSFFHLSRLQELRLAGTELPEAVEGMVQNAGRVVLVSGVVLLFTWLALACFPVFGIDSLGYCASVTIACCILVNMILNPALVLAFPGFFSRAAQDPCRRCRRRREGNLSTPQNVADNVYGKIASQVTKMPWALVVPLLVYAAFAPAAIAIFQAKFSVGGVQPATDASSMAQYLLADFPETTSGAPLLVLLSSRREGSVKSAEYFDVGCQLAVRLQKDLGLTADSIRGVMLQPAAPSDISLTCLQWDAAQLNHSGLYQWVWRQAVNLENSSSMLTILPPYNTFSNKAKDLVAQARSSIDTFKQRFPGWVTECYHPMGVEIDAELLTWSRFPWVVSITVFIVFSTIGLRYRAALVPVKLLFTIAIPILFTLGCGVFVFQDGWLNWTKIPSLQGQGGLVWINPVACSFMLVGFALDYDLFLFSRIFQERHSGAFVEDRVAIVHSVAATGPVITTAGIIMALAFSGMVVQHCNPFLCQMGFTMILGVLVDTFVVRTLLVPALLSMAGRFNWWPGSMPSACAVEGKNIPLAMV